MNRLRAALFLFLTALSALSLPALAAQPAAAYRAAPRWEAQVGSTTVDVTPSMQRIEAGARNPHRNDGTRFQNRERRLPAGGTYTEYVVPTPGVRGPGPKRIVVNGEGRAWYTPDHYAHFYPVTKR